MLLIKPLTHSQTLPMTSLTFSQMNTKRSRTRLMDKRIITYKLMRMKMMMKISQMNTMKAMKMKRNTWTRQTTLSMMTLNLIWPIWKKTTWKSKLSKLRSQRLKTSEQALMMKTKMIGNLLDHSRRDTSKDGTMMKTTHGIKRMLMIGKLWESENITNGARRITRKKDSERKESTTMKERKENSTTKTDKIESKNNKKFKSAQLSHYFNKAQLKNNQRWRLKIQRKLKLCHLFQSSLVLPWCQVCNTSQTLSLRKWLNSTT